MSRYLYLSLFSQTSNGFNYIAFVFELKDVVSFIKIRFH